MYSATNLRFTGRTQASVFFFCKVTNPQRAGCQSLASQAKRRDLGPKVASQI